MEAGIYSIVNIVNNKVYIGYTNNFRKRKNCHWSELKKGTHKNTHLLGAWNKYGEKSFKFERIEICEIEKLKEREHYWAKIYNAHDRSCGYNIELTSNNKNEKRTKETIDKISEANKGRKHSDESRKRMSLGQLGKKIPKEVCEKMSESRRGVKRKPETIEKISKAQKGKRKPIKLLTAQRKEQGRATVMLSMGGEYIAEYSCLGQAAETISITKSTIWNVLNKGKKTAANKVFVYKENYVPEKDYSVKRQNGVYLQYPVIMMDLDSVFLKEFNSCAEAVIYLKSIGFKKAVTSGISNAINGKTAYYQKFKWKRKYDTNEKSK